jgi:hypothetical protein
LVVKKKTGENFYHKGRKKVRQAFFFFSAHAHMFGQVGGKSLTYGNFQVALNERRVVQVSFAFGELHSQMVGTLIGGNNGLQKIRAELLGRMQLKCR